jgi:hypothetical protein
MTERTAWTELRKELGVEVRALREQRGWSQTEPADRAG